MSEMTLEPCPFCGAKDAEVYPRDRSNLAWNVCCGNPGCVTRGDNDYLTKSDAVAAWNRRAHLAQPAQAVDVGAIREVIDRLRINPSITAQECADSLAVALSGEKAGPVDGEVTWRVLQIGAGGCAYDPPNTCRAFTYEHQPGNVLAWSLGRASSAAAKASAGDYIDGGLNLLKALQAEGFGAFQLPASPTPDKE